MMAPTIRASIKSCIIGYFIAFITCNTVGPGITTKNPGNIHKTIGINILTGIRAAIF
jgi:hypothetical protein